MTLLYSIIHELLNNIAPNKPFSSPTLESTIYSSTLFSLSFYIYPPIALTNYVLAF